jgi:hypothetical protein
MRRLSNGHAAALLAHEKKVQKGYVNLFKKMMSGSPGEDVENSPAAKQLINLLDEWVRLFIVDPTATSRKRIIKVDEERILLITMGGGLAASLAMGWDAKKFVETSRPSYNWLVDYSTQ